MRSFVLTSLFLGICCAAPAASEPKPYGNAGDWEVFISDAETPACYARRFFDDGTEAQIGRVPSDNGWYFAAYNSAWTQIDAGTVEQVEFEFSEVIFAGDAEMRTQADVPGGYVFFNNPEFLQEFGNQMSLRISGPEGDGIEIDLSGSKQAVGLVDTCQDAAGNAENGSDDN